MPYSLDIQTSYTDLSKELHITAEDSDFNGRDNTLTFQASNVNKP